LNSVEQTAQLLFKAVKRASVTPSEINVGDRIVVTGAKNDVTGIVNNIEMTKNVTTLTINTNSGEKILKVSNKNFIHIIQRAAMLNLRNHTDYERGVEDTDKDVHKYTEKDERPKLGPVLDSKESKLPTSKISLVLKKKKGDK